MHFNMEDPSRRRCLHPVAKLSPCSLRCSQTNNCSYALAALPAATNQKEPKVDAGTKLLES